MPAGVFVPAGRRCPQASSSPQGGSAALGKSYEGSINGCLDFLFLREIRNFFAYQNMDSDFFGCFLNHQDSFYSRDFIRPAFLDNHDQNRFLWTAKEDDVRTYMGNSKPEFSRTAMVWGEKQDSSLLNYYRDLCHVRSRHMALRRGSRVTLSANTPGVYAYGKYTGEELILVVLNNNMENQPVTLSFEELQQIPRFQFQTKKIVDSLNNYRRLSY